MGEQGIMYRFRQGEDPGEVSLDNLQRLASGPDDQVVLELWRSGYDVIRELPLIEEGPITLYAASDNRAGGEGGENFLLFGLGWVLGSR